MSPAGYCANLLQDHLRHLERHVFIDSCAGAGGPTPEIERILNSKLTRQGKQPVKFVLTDLYPNIRMWSEAAKGREGLLTFEGKPVNATDAGAVVEKWKRVGVTGDRANGNGNGNGNADVNGNAGDGGIRMRRTEDGKRTDGMGRVCRVFNLAFHHFDDDMARNILQDTMENSHAFAIFELQDRTAESFFTTLLFGIGILCMTPYYAWKWRSWEAIIFTYIIPIVPFVLVVDGWISGIRTRTPEEVRELLDTCGSKTTADDWVITAGRTKHMWPCGYLNWIICQPKKD